jgi:hypothetical protein
VLLGNIPEWDHVTSEFILSALLKDMFNGVKELNIKGMVAASITLSLIN